MTVLRLDLANDQFRFETELKKRASNFNLCTTQQVGKMSQMTKFLALQRRRFTF